MPTERPNRDILLVAATAIELCGHDGLSCGVGPVEAAAATARALALEAPSAVLHVGLAGGRGIEIGSLVVGTESVYCDLSATIPLVDRVLPDGRLVAAARAALPGARALPVGTSAAVAGPRGSEPRGLPVEAMEGFGVLRAAGLAGVPAVEVRAISNRVADARETWRIEDALAALAAAIPRLLDALSR